ncbi:Type I restriction-modification system, specificity subunit S [Azospirillum argentinense]
MEHLEQGTGRILQTAESDDLSSIKTKFQAGDVLFGKLRPNLRKTAHPDFDGICSTDIIVVRAKPDIDPSFLFYTLNRTDTFSHAIKSAAGTKMPRTSWALMSGFTFHLPPLPEQRRIAEILSSVEEALAVTQAVIEQTRTAKQAVLECLLTKGIGNTRFKQTEFGLIPADWEIVPLRTVAHIQTGVAKGKKDIQDPVELPYLRVANVQDGHIDLTELKTITVSASQVDRYSLRPGDVLMTEGGDFDKLGRGDVWKGQVPVCLHQNHVFAVRPNPDLLVSEFLAALTASAHGKGYFLGCAKRTTNLASINSTQVKDFPVLLPGKEEQERIVQQVAAYSLAERSASDALAQLEKTKAALLSDLLTGRKRVTADALSPAV